MDEIKKCLCGADPIIEKKTTGDLAVPEAYKYRCPNCEEKELPYLGQWHDCGALQEWNNIAHKSRYKKRPFEYNVHGVCISPPFQTLEWRNKKYDHVTIDFFCGNSRYFYCIDYYYNNKGHGSSLWISDPCFISLEMAKKSAMKSLEKHHININIIHKLFSPVQGELFT